MASIQVYFLLLFLNICIFVIEWRMGKLRKEKEQMEKKRGKMNVTSDSFHLFFFFFFFFLFDFMIFFSTIFHNLNSNTNIQNKFINRK